MLLWRMIQQAIHSGFTFSDGSAALGLRGSVAAAYLEGVMTSQPNRLCHFPPFNESHRVASRIAAQRIETIEEVGQNMETLNAYNSVSTQL